MSAAVIGLALASTVRPTSVAAVYALLASHEPRRLLSIYIAAGFVVSAAFGIVVVGILHTTITLRSSPHALFDLFLGVAALAFAAGVAAGTLGRHEPDSTTTSQVPDRLRHPSPKLAAGAGIATHLPGLFYLAALADILAGRPSLLGATIDVLLYNLIWFAAAIAALAFFVARPDSTRSRVAALNAWGARHERRVLIVVFAVLGAYLIAKGLRSLVGS